MPGFRPGRSVAGTVVETPLILGWDRAILLSFACLSLRPIVYHKNEALVLVTYANAKGYRISKIVKEVGSGVNDKRSKFLSILADDTANIILVEHRDRATRFGFNYLQVLLEQQGRRIEVVNEVEHDKEELMQDLIAIITSFVARYYGQRRSKRKTEQLLQALKANDEVS